MFHLNQLDRLVPGMCARLLVLGSDQAYALRALTPSWKKLSISILLVRRKSGDIVLLHRPQSWINTIMRKFLVEICFGDLAHVGTI